MVNRESQDLRALRVFRGEEIPPCSPCLRGENVFLRARFRPRYAQCVAAFHKRANEKATRQQGGLFFKGE